ASKVFPRIRPEQARRSLALLTELGFIVYDDQQERHVLCQETVSTGDEVQSMFVVRYHQKMIEIGRESITLVHESERDVSAITVCVSTEASEKMKREIQLFRKQML